MPMAAGGAQDEKRLTIWRSAGARQRPAIACRLFGVWAALRSWDRDAPFNQPTVSTRMGRELIAGDVEPDRWQIFIVTLLASGTRSP
jgi:hypothetical protein